MHSKLCRMPFQRHWFVLMSVLSYISNAIDPSISINWSGPYPLQLSPKLANCGWGFRNNSLVMCCDSGVYKFNINTKNITKVYPFDNSNMGFDSSGQYAYQIEEYLYYWENQNGHNMKRYNMDTNEFEQYNTDITVPGYETGGSCIAGMVDPNNISNHIVFIHGGEGSKYLYVKLIF